MVKHKLNTFEGRELLEAARGLFGPGYLNVESPFASQDYVSKSAIRRLRAAIKAYEKAHGLEPNAD